MRSLRLSASIFTCDRPSTAIKLFLPPLLQLSPELRRRALSFEESLATGTSQSCRTPKLARFATMRDWVGSAEDPRGSDELLYSDTPVS